MDGIDINELARLAQLSQANIGPSEEDLKLKFLVPLLEALGHERGSLDFERTGKAGRPDVVIRRLGVVIDTKAYGNNLNDHLVQLGNYAVHEGAVIAVITNGEEIRLYSPLRGISFERSLLHSISQSEIAQERGIEVLSNFLSRKSLTNGQANWHIDARDKELREAYARLDELAEKCNASVEDVNADIAGLEEQRQEIDDQIEAKYGERSGIEEQYRYQVAAVWHVLGLQPHADGRSASTLAQRTESVRRRVQDADTPDFASLILQTISELGGSGRVSDVIDRIERKLNVSGHLTPYWLELDPVQIRWKHAVHSTRFQLVKQGKIAAKSARGIWQLT